MLCASAGMHLEDVWGTVQEETSDPQAGVALPGCGQPNTGEFFRTMQTSNGNQFTSQSSCQKTDVYKLWIDFTSLAKNERFSIRTPPSPNPAGVKFGVQTKNTGGFPKARGHPWLSFGSNNLR